MEKIRVFLGKDPNETVGFYTCLESLLSRTDPNQVSITAITGDKEDASNTFSKQRFLVPYLCGFSGWAIFIDGADMMFRADIRELWDLREPGYDVMVVPHSYSTKHPTKFLGQANDDYPKKNQSSVMLMNCGNYPWRKVTPKYVSEWPASHFHRFEFLKPDRVGDLPREWNHLVGEQEFNPDAKIAHFTIGLPCWPAYKDWDYAGEWFNELRKVNHFQSWEAEAYDDSPLVSER